MSFIRTFFNIILDSLFPLSGTEKEVLSYSPEQACLKLSPAPPFTGLAVALRQTFSIFAYKDEHVSKLIWHIKYKKSAKAVAIGGYALYRGIESKPELLNKPIVIIPIPISPKRRRERGFNQIELLIDEIKCLDKTGLLTIENHLLERVVHADRQTLKSRTDRLQDSKGIFAVNEEILKKFHNSEFVNHIFIVIDDVITTGSTMKEALKTLKSAGLKNIYGLSLAH